VQTGALGGNTAWDYVAQNITSAAGDIGRVSIYFRNVGIPVYTITAYIYDGHVGNSVNTPAGGNTLLGTSTNTFLSTEISSSLELYYFYFNDILVNSDYSIVLGFTDRGTWDGSNKLDIGIGTPPPVDGLNTSVYYTITYDFRSSTTTSITVDYTGL